MNLMNFSLNLSIKQEKANARASRTSQLHWLFSIVAKELII